MILIHRKEINLESFILITKESVLGIKIIKKTDPITMKGKTLIFKQIKENAKEIL